MRDFRNAKAMAKTLRQALSRKNLGLSQSEALELVAAQFGLRDWNALSAAIERAGMPNAGTAEIAPPIPIFRIFDVAKAMEFYRDFLGFTVDWEHRFGENFPLYCQVSRSKLRLHLSEHAGDASPGARAFVPIEGIDAYHAELHAKQYRYMKPGIETAPWGREMAVTDPFSNRLTFCEWRPS